jgi:hypothetical protein
MRRLRQWLDQWWDAHSCECGATLIIFLSMEDHKGCMRHLGWQCSQDLNVMLANAVLDSLRSRVVQQEGDR